MQLDACVLMTFMWPSATPMLSGLPRQAPCRCDSEPDGLEFGLFLYFMSLSLCLPTSEMDS